MQRIGDFRFTDISWHEVAHKVADPYATLSELLNKSLKIKEYGTILDYIFLIFIVDNATVHRARKYYSAKNNYLSVRRRLDYEKFVKANDQEALEIMALSFLDVIKQFPKWKIKDFDWERLYADAQKLFVEHHFIRENR